MAEEQDSTRHGVAFLDGWFARPPCQTRNAAGPAGDCRDRDFSKVSTCLEIQLSFFARRLDKRAIMVLQVKASLEESSPGPRRFA